MKLWENQIKDVTVGKLIEDSGIMVLISGKVNVNNDIYKVQHSEKAELQTFYYIPCDHSYSVNLLAPGPHNGDTSG